MRLRHIEVFHAIMQVGTISGAAQVLHISQSAVTKVLQHAKLQLGMPLFERVRGKLYPKPEAHRLFAETEKLNRDLQGIRRLAAPAIPVQLYLLTASHAPLSHGARELAMCIGATACALLEKGCA